MSELPEGAIRVLDDGFIKLVDHMGGDDAIVQAARVSYGKGTKKKSDDRGLIRYLMRHWHTTPFEMVEFKFLVRVPMDAWRQWIRHRTANVNEYSTRYSEAIDSQQTTKEDEWRFQSKNNKQGSGNFLDPILGHVLTDQEWNLQQYASKVYKARLEAGVAREQARKDLPLSTYTEAYWKCDLHNIFHFLRLRMDSHAQLEIREYANAMYQLIQPVCPIACEAFEDYRLSGVILSSVEIKRIREYLQKVLRCGLDLYNTGIEMHDLLAPIAPNKKKIDRELDEFKNKLGLE